MKYQTMFFLLALLIASCTPATPDTLPPDSIVTNPLENTMPVNDPPANPFAPKPGDVNLTRGEVFIKESGLLIRESSPPQIALFFSGDLPTACHELRALVSLPDTENKIMVDIYSVVDPDIICAQALEPFRENIELGTFPKGRYAVWVNGKFMDVFDS